MSGPTDFLPNYASYNWTGAPADFSLTTNPDSGGDSSKQFNTPGGLRRVRLAMWLTVCGRTGKCKQVVPIRRPGLHHCGFGHGHGHGSWTGFPIFRSRPKEIGPVNDVGLYGRRIHHHGSMVPLGIFSDLFTDGNEWIHW